VREFSHSLTAWLRTSRVVARATLWRLRAARRRGGLRVGARTPAVPPGPARPDR